MDTSGSGSEAARDTCRCGHAASLHEHYRRGDDCGVCGASVCPRFRRQRAEPLHRLRSMLRRRPG